MTARTLSSAMRERAIAALDLVDAYNARNLPDVERITRGNAPEDLMLGFVLLASGLLHGHAAASGVTVDQLDLRIRSMYLADLAGDAA